MRDPFRPNSNSQLIREAQFAFVVIVVLLGVLVYVAIHRVTGRRFHFNRIAQTAPLAQHINDNAYPAQSRHAHKELAHNELASQESPAMPQSVARPAPNQTHQTQPVAPTVSVTATPFPDTPIIARAQFIEPPKSKPALKSVPQNPRPISKPAVDDPFERINGPSFTPIKPASRIEKETNRSIDSENPNQTASDALLSSDPAAGFLPPTIRSNFGAGSTRELPSFDSQTRKTIAKETPVEKATTAEVAMPTSRPRLTQPKQSRLSSFVPPQKTSSPFDPPLNSKKIPEAKDTKVANVLKKEIPKTKPPSLGPQEYRVQTNDSLWSIALDHYGDGRFFRALHEHNLNRITSADNLEPNTTLVIPEVELLIERYNELCPADKLNARSNRTDDGPKNDSFKNDASKTDYDRYEKRMDNRFHITQHGETLFDVARRRLGQASRYLEIFELNRFRIPQHANHLTPLDPGLRLLLPE